MSTATIMELLNGQRTITAVPKGVGLSPYSYTELWEILLKEMKENSISDINLNEKSILGFIEKYTDGEVIGG